VTITPPSDFKHWLMAGLSFGILGAGLTLLAHDEATMSLLWRTVAAFVLGFIVAAIWWALSYLAGYGVHAGFDPANQVQPASPRSVKPTFGEDGTK
jgi:4-amino-4-deoxy-L-arabinose transferase-like glycosyltransferase